MQIVWFAPDLADYGNTAHSLLFGGSQRSRRFENFTFQIRKSQTCKCIRFDGLRRRHEICDASAEMSISRIFEKTGSTVSEIIVAVAGSRNLNFRGSAPGFHSLTNGRHLSNDHHPRIPRNPPQNWASQWLQSSILLQRTIIPTNMFDRILQSVSWNVSERPGTIHQHGMRFGASNVHVGTSRANF